MTVRDLLAVRQDSYFKNDKSLRSDLIALDGKDGKVLFSTAKNCPEFIDKFYDAKISTLWADVKLVTGIGFGDYFKPVMKCYLEHGSWEAGND